MPTWHDDFDEFLGRPTRIRKTQEQMDLRDRVVAAFLAVEAARHGWDCLVIDRPTLCRLLSVKRISTPRLDHFLTALSRWFGFQKVEFHADSPKAVHSLVLATLPGVPLEKHLTTLEQVAQLRRQEVRAVNFSFFDDGVDLTDSLQAVIDELRAIAANR